MNQLATHEAKMAVEEALTSKGKNQIGFIFIILKQLLTNGLQHIKPSRKLAIICLQNKNKNALTKIPFMI